MKQPILFVLILCASQLTLHAQTMRMIPDTGIQSKGEAVTIVGIGTKFSSTKNASLIQVLLKKTGVTYGFGISSTLINDSTILLK